MKFTNKSKAMLYNINRIIKHVSNVQFDNFVILNDGIQHDLNLVIVGRKERIYKRGYNRSKIFNSD